MDILSSIKKVFQKQENRPQQEIFGAYATTDRRSGFARYGYFTNPNEQTKLESSIENYDKLLFDAHVASCVQSRKSGVLSMDYEIASNEENTNHAEFIEQMFNKLNIHRIISEMLDCVFYGYKPMEIYYGISEGRIVISDIIGKPPAWFKYKNGSFRFISMDNFNGEFIPPYKMLILQNNPTYTNPYGEAVLARCLKPLYLKNGGMELWSLYTQKYGMPFLHGSIDTGTSSDIDKLTDQLFELRQDGVIATADRVQIEAITGTNSNSSDNYKMFIHFCNSEISKAILSQTLTTEQGDTGSYAMSQTHLEVRDDVINADKKLVERAFETIIKWILDLNFDNVIEYPRFTLYGDLVADINLANRDATLFGTGYVKPTKEYLMRHHDFKEDEIEMVDPQPATAFSEFEEHEHSAGDLTPLDDAAQKIIDSLVGVIEDGTSYDEIKAGLIEKYPNLDTGKIENFISDAILKAQNKGE